MPSFRRQAPRSKASAFALSAPPSGASAAASVSSDVGGGRGEEVEGPRIFINNVSEETDLKKAYGKNGTRNNQRNRDDEVRRDGDNGEHCIVQAEVAEKVLVPAVALEDTKKGTAMRRIPARKRMTEREIETVR